MVFLTSKTSSKLSFYYSILPHPPACPCVSYLIALTVFKISTKQGCFVIKLPYVGLMCIQLHTFSEGCQGTLLAYREVKVNL